MLRKTCSSALIFVLVGVARLAAQQWSATRVLQVGENEGLTLGKVAGMAGSADGRLYVLDQSESKVHILSSTGKIERSFGKRGAGPGELSAAASNIVLYRGQILVVDLLNQRVNLYNGDGSFVRSRPIRLTEGVPISWVAAGDRVVTALRPIGSLVAGQAGGVTEHTVIAFDPRADSAPDTLLRVHLPMDNQISMGSTLRMKLDLRVPQVFLAGDGGEKLLVATSDTYRIRVFGSNGKVAGAITRNAARRRYTTAEVARLKHETDSAGAAAMKAGASYAASATGRAVQMPKVEMEYLFPEFAPVLTNLIAGNQYVLVQRTIEKNSPTDWDVLTYDGKFVGTVRFPAAFSARTMIGDRVIGAEKDELDVESVAVYRIAPKK